MIQISNGDAIQSDSERNENIAPDLTPNFNQFGGSADPDVAMGSIRDEKIRKSSRIEKAPAVAYSSSCSDGSGKKNDA